MIVIGIILGTLFCLWLAGKLGAEHFDNTHYYICTACKTKYQYGQMPTVKVDNKTRIRCTNPECNQEAIEWVGGSINYGRYVEFPDAPILHQKLCDKAKEKNNN